MSAFLNGQKLEWREEEFLIFLCTLRELSAEA